MIPPNFPARLREIQDASMFDACQVLTYSSADDPYNNPVPTFTPEPEIVCGINLKKSKELLQEGQVIKTDGEIRLPIETIATGRDRIRVIRRHGTVIDPVDYEIIGDPKRGPSGLVADIIQVVE